MFKKTLLLTILIMLTGCESITDTNQSFAIHTGSVSGDPRLLTDCAAERDKHKWYIIEAPGWTEMEGEKKLNYLPTGNY